MMEYKPVLKQEAPLHYVSDSDMIKFIEQNSDMKWNDICEFVRKVGICSPEGEPVYWVKTDIEDERQAKYYNDDQVKWVKSFFEAHPWIERMMLIFDD